MSVCFGVIVCTRINERCFCVRSGVLVRSAPCDPGVCVLSPLCCSASCAGVSDGSVPRRLCGQKPLQLTNILRAAYSLDVVGVDAGIRSRPCRRTQSTQYISTQSTLLTCLSCTASTLRASAPGGISNRKRSQPQTLKGQPATGAAWTARSTTMTRSATELVPRMPTSARP